MAQAKPLIEEIPVEGVEEVPIEGEVSGEELTAQDIAEIFEEEPTTAETTGKEEERGLRLRKRRAWYNVLVDFLRWMFRR